MQPGEIKIIPRIIVDGSKMLWYDSTVGAFGRNAFLFAYRFPSVQLITCNLAYRPPLAPPMGELAAP